MSKAKKVQEPEAQQQEMDGFRPPKIREVDNAFKRWLEAKQENETAKKKTNELRQKLLDKMKEHEVPMYGYRGWIAKLEEEEKLLISKTPKEGEEDEADEDGGDSEAVTSGAEKSLPTGDRE